MTELLQYPGDERWFHFPKYNFHKSVLYCGISGLMGLNEDLRELYWFRKPKGGDKSTILVSNWELYTHLQKK